jgi:uncharacterized membrane protein
MTKEMNFLALAIVYLVLDLLWIRGMTPLLYKPTFETIQKTPLTFRPEYAVAAYLVLLGVLYWICRPLSAQYQPKWLAYTLVGFAVYAIFNLTNAAVFTEYPSKMVLVDTLWGTTVFTLLGMLDSS